MNEDYELYHYGVLGMKWGVRKSYNTNFSTMKPKKRTKAVREYLDNTEEGKKIKNTASKNFDKQKYHDLGVKRVIANSIYSGFQYEDSNDSGKRALLKAAGMKVNNIHDQNEVAAKSEKPENDEYNYRKQAADKISKTIDDVSNNSMSSSNKSYIVSYLLDDPEDDVKVVKEGMSIVNDIFDSHN